MVPTQAPTWTNSASAAGSALSAAAVGRLVESTPRAVSQFPPD